MTDDEINKAIAKACGIEDVDQWGPIYKTPSGWMRDRPDYANDLNAMHEAEMSEEMTFNQKWIESIVEISLRESALTIESTDGWDWVAFVSRLTARQRAEAFLRTINLWKQ